MCPLQKLCASIGLLFIRTEFFDLTKMFGFPISPAFPKPDVSEAASSFTSTQTQTSETPEKQKHAMELMVSLSQLRSAGDECDFTITVNQQTYRVHRAVLAASSKYFRAMFRNAMKEKEEGMVDMKDVDPGAVKLCIDFMYTGEAVITCFNVRPVLHAANLMQVNQVVAMCSRYLQSNITVTNCLDFLILGRLYADCDLIKVAVDYIVNHLDTVIETNNFGSIEKEDLVQYLKAVSNDNTVWKAAVKWIMHNVETRGEHIVEFVRIMKFLDFQESLISDIWGNQLVANSQPCQKVILDKLFTDTHLLERNVDVSNCYILQQLLRSDERDNAEKNRNVIFSYMADNFETVSTDRKFVELSANDFNDLVSHIAKRDIRYEQKWEAILKWIRHDEERTSLLSDFLYCLKLEGAPAEFIYQVKSEPLVTKSEVCKSMLLDACCPKPDKEYIAVSTISPGGIFCTNPEERKWTPLDGPKSEWSQKLISSQGRLYLLNANILYVYMDDKKWVKLPVMQHVPEGGAKLVSLGARIYVVEQQTMSYYDTSECVWVEGLPGCSLGMDFCAAASDYDIYAIGGKGTVKKAIRYNPARNKWSEIESTSHDRVNSAAVFCSHKIYIMGGDDSNKVECYDTFANKWTIVASMRYNRMKFGACVAGGKIVALYGALTLLRGGRIISTQSDHSRTCEVYDPCWDSWSVVSITGAPDGITTTPSTACCYTASVPAFKSPDMKQLTFSATACPVPNSKHTAKILPVTK